jgi:hypothetical protein
LKLKLKHLNEEEKKEPAQRPSSVLGASSSRIKSAKKAQEGRQQML